MSRANVAAGTRNQFTGVVGLAQIIVRTQAQPTGHIGWLASRCRHHNNRDACGARIVPQHLDRLKPINVRHLDIHEDEIGVQLLGLFHRHLSILCFLNTELLTFQNAAQQHSGLLFVVSYQDERVSLCDIRYIVIHKGNLD